MPIDGETLHPHAARLLREGIDATALAGRTIRLTEDAAMQEGAFSLADAGGQVEVRGGPFSGVIYGAQELVARLGRKLDVSILARGPIADAPGLPYRTFWTWDHSTNWELSQIGQQEIGVFNPYQKPPSGFLADYRRLVDYCSANRIGGIVIYGFLRDSHGGVEAAQELCRYGRERGVRIIPGIAIGAYGGVYWEGNHRYNLNTWLKQNPQHKAEFSKDIGFQLADLDFPLNFPHSDYTVTACPSAPEMMDWMEEAVAWLAETFDIGGINIESGDYGVCDCPRCKARRANDAEAARRAKEYGDSWSHSDMAANFPRLYRAAKAVKPDLWIYCEMQWDNLLEPVAAEVQAALPRGGIYQHTCNRSYWKRLRQALPAGYVENLPTQPNVLRCQFACQWNGDARTERDALNARDFADMSRQGYRMGMQGLTVWGEPSDYNAATEISYLAFARFGWEPELTWDAFVARDVAPLFGGADQAKRFIAIAEEIDAKAALPPERLDELLDETVAALSTATPEPRRRWLSLADRIGRRRHMGR
ncbi:MAG: hypothetical protein J0I98_05790 [Mesorhizobium sp.]|nr:hypothetical protein [Mesorhizobium sp.]MBN9242288.1 hypothetical protein [Mesorhizobium sp.]